jgi:hypothetical protein
MLGVAAFDKQAFFAGIIRIVEDAQRLEITRFDLEVYGQGDWLAIKNALTLWEKREYLIVLRDPEHAASDDVCIRMFSIHGSKKRPDCL